jgi:lysophospholipase L1-like esterase
VALILCIALLVLARHHYAEVLAAKVWPAGKVVVAHSARAAPQSITILLLGDSRVADWKSPRIEGWHVLNEGIGGLTSAELALNCGTILEQTRPQGVVIQIGINDLKLLGVRPECRMAVIDGCVSNILVVVNECRRLGAQVVLTPVWPVGRVSGVRRLVWSDAIEPAVAETNQRLTDLLSNKAGVYVVDIFAELTKRLSTSQRLQLYRDTLHLKPDVYLSLSELLSATVHAHFDKSEMAEP